MNLGKTVLYSRLFMQLLIIFLGLMIVVQGVLRKANFVYDFLGVAIIAYGAYRLYGTLSLLFKGDGKNGH